MQAKSRKSRTRTPKTLVPKIPVGEAEKIETADLSGAHGAFVERLRMLINRAGSIVAFAAAIGVSDTSVHLWLRDSEPSRDKLVRIANAMSLSLEWLIRGRGPMRADQLPEGYAILRRYPLENEVDVQGIDYLAVKVEWVKSLPGSPRPEALFLGQASGDSMAPSIRNGDLFLVNASDRELRDGIYAFTQPPNEIFTRRVVSLGDGKHQLLCDNEAYRLPAGPAAEVRPPVYVFGRIIWTSRVI